MWDSPVLPRSLSSISPVQGVPSEPFRRFWKTWIFLPIEQIFAVFFFNLINPAMCLRSLHSMFLRFPTCFRVLLRLICVGTHSVSLWVPQHVSDGSAMCFKSTRTCIYSKVPGRVSRKRYIRFHACLRPVFRVACNRLPNSSRFRISEKTQEREFAVGCRIPKRISTAILEIPKKRKYVKGM